MARAVILLVVVLISSAVRANVISYTLQRRNAYNQEPNGSGYFISSDFTVTLTTTDPADFDSAGLTGPPPADVPAALAKNDAVHELLVATGSSPEEEFTVFPLGVYTLTAAGGSLGAQSALLDDSAPAFTSAPFFTNYEHYETRNAGEPVTIDVTGFTPRAGSTHNFANYVLYEDAGGGIFTSLVSGVHEGSAPFSFGLRPGVTRADRAYLFGVDFISETQTTSAGFGSATAIVRAIGSNSSSFHVFAVPEPTIGVGGMAVSIIMLRSRRARNVLL